MPSYHLHRTMRHASSGGGRAFARDTIDAPDLASAIGIATARIATAPHLLLTSAILTALSGAILWSASNLLDEEARLLPTMS